MEGAAGHDAPLIHGQSAAAWGRHAPASAPSANAVTATAPTVRDSVAGKDTGFAAKNQR